MAVVDVLFDLVDETVVVEQKIAEHFNPLVTCKNGFFSKRTENFFSRVLFLLDGFSLKAAPCDVREAAKKGSFFSGPATKRGTFFESLKKSPKNWPLSSEGGRGDGKGFKKEPFLRFP